MARAAVICGASGPDPPVVAGRPLSFSSSKPGLERMPGPPQPGHWGREKELGVQLLLGHHREGSVTRAVTRTRMRPGSLSRQPPASPATKQSADIFWYLIRIENKTQASSPGNKRATGPVVRLWRNTDFSFKKKAFVFKTYNKNGRAYNMQFREGKRVSDQR